MIGHKVKRYMKRDSDGVTLVESFTPTVIPSRSNVLPSFIHKCTNKKIYLVPPKPQTPEKSFNQSNGSVPGA